MLVINYIDLHKSKQKFVNLRHFFLEALLALPEFPSVTCRFYRVSGNIKY